MSQLETVVAERLRERFPGLKIVEDTSLLRGGRFDLHAEVDGCDYFIQIKQTDCNRVVLGQIIDHYSELSKVSPKARLIVVCRKAREDVREALKKLSIEVLTFQDLNIPLERKISRGRSPSIDLSPSEQGAYFLLQRKGLSVVRTRDLAVLLGRSEAYTRNLLFSLSRKGVLYRIGRGKYVVISPYVLYQRKGHVGDPLLLIDQIMRGEPYYVGYGSAASYHGIAHQLPFDASIVVLRQRRPVRLDSTSIRFIRTIERRFFGFSEVRYSEAFVKVSDVEKTVLDCLDRQDLCGGVSETTRTIANALRKIEWDKLLKYLSTLGNRALAQRLGFILEKLSERKEYDISTETLKTIEKLRGPHLYLLDVSSSRQGKVSHRWRIIENKNCMEWYQHA